MTAGYDSTIASTCPARHVCGAHPSRSSRPACGVTCVGYTELADQVRMSAIPRRYHDIQGAPASRQSVAALLREANAPAAGFIEAWGGDIREHVAAGRGLYLHGRTTGTGKTTAAAALALDYVRGEVSAALEARKAVGRQLTYYVHVPSFLRTTKAIYEQDDEVSRGASAVIATMTRTMTAVPLVIFDDIGAEKVSESVRERMLTIIDARYTDALSTIYTSNLTLNELEMALGARIRSRIEGATTAIPFGGSDKRRKGAM